MQQQSNQAVQMDSPADVVDARETLTARAKMPKVLNSAAITAFFAEVGGAEKSRLNWLVGLMFQKSETGSLSPTVDWTAVRDATKGYVDDKAKAAGWKAGKGAGKPPSAVKSARNRASEIKALYGATRYAGFNPTGRGYHEAVSGAIESLAVKGIKPDGSRVPDEEARKRARLVSVEKSKVESAVEAAGSKAAELGRPLTNEERAEIFGNAEGEYLKATAVDICADILKRHGVKMAEEVAAYMPQAIETFEAGLK